MHHHTHRPQKEPRTQRGVLSGARRGKRRSAHRTTHSTRPFATKQQGRFVHPPFGVLSQTFRATARLMYRLRSSPVVRPARSYLHSPARDADTQGQVQATWETQPKHTTADGDRALRKTRSRHQVVQPNTVGACVTFPRQSQGNRQPQAQDPPTTPRLQLYAYNS